MKKAKAQSEIMGMVILVIIITISLLIYLVYSTTSTDSSSGTIYQQYAYNDLATSYINTLLKTNIQECGDFTVEDILIDCGTTDQILCAGSSSCVLLKNIITNLKNDTLDVWDIPYGLEIYLDSSSDDPFYSETLSQHPCLPGKVGRGAPGIFHIPYFPLLGSAKIELGFCMP